MTVGEFENVLKIGEHIGVEFKRDRLFADNANRAAAHGIITPENVSPVSKNPILASFFKQIGRADELGSGTRSLYRYTRLYSGADPVMDEEDVFAITIPLNADFSPETGSGASTAAKSDGQVGGTNNLPVNLSATAKKIYLLLGEEGGRTYDNLAATLGVTRETVRVSIRSLVNAKLVRRIGPDKGGHWEVVTP